MKKAYNKPLFSMEQFSLTQSIAKSCGWTGGDTSIGRPGHANKNMCGWVAYGQTFWLQDNEVCTTTMAADGVIDGYCYNTPVAGMSIFAS